MNTFLPMEVVEFLLLKPGVELYLVHGRFNCHVVKNALDFLLGEVGNSDCLSFTGFDKAFNGSVDLLTSQ